MAKVKKDPKKDSKKPKNEKPKIQFPPGTPAFEQRLIRRYPYLTAELARLRALPVPASFLPTHPEEAKDPRAH